MSGRPDSLENSRTKATVLAVGADAYGVHLDSFLSPIISLFYLPLSDID